MVKTSQITKSQRLQDLAVLRTEAGIVELERVKFTKRELVLLDWLGQGGTVADAPLQFGCTAGKIAGIADSLLRKLAMDLIGQMAGGGAHGYAEALRQARQARRARRVPAVFRLR
jgi:hypothetical protein